MEPELMKILVAFIKLIDENVDKTDKVAMGVVDSIPALLETIESEDDPDTHLDQFMHRLFIYTSDGFSNVPSATVCKILFKRVLEAPLHLSDDKVRCCISSLDCRGSLFISSL